MLARRNYDKIIYALLFLTINTVLSIENNFVLIISLYNESHKKRIAEYIECLDKNLAHPLIEKIHVIYDTSKDEEQNSAFLERLKSKNITLSTVSGRPSFEDCFNLANELYPDRAIIVSNADIYFNETLYLIQDYDLNNKMLALSRWNVQRDGLLKPIVHLNGKPNMGSQDTWIFTTPIKQINAAEIQLGTLYCDGRIAYAVQEAGFKIINPCLSIQCCHLHLSKVRHYKFSPCVYPTILVPWCAL